MNKRTVPRFNYQLLEGQYSVPPLADDEWNLVVRTLKTTKVIEAVRDEEDTLP